MRCATARETAGYTSPPRVSRHRRRASSPIDCAHCPRSTIRCLTKRERPGGIAACVSGWHAWPPNMRRPHTGTLDERPTRVKARHATETAAAAPSHLLFRLLSDARRRRSILLAVLEQPGLQRRPDRDLARADAACTRGCAPRLGLARRPSRRAPDAGASDHCCRGTELRRPLVRKDLRRPVRCHLAAERFLVRGAAARGGDHDGES